MKLNIIKSVVLLATAVFLTACTDSDKPYDTVNLGIKTYEFAVTKQVSEINSTVGSAAPTLYTADDIIEAYVTSTDANGTFYKSISFQTLPAIGETPIGFSMAIDGTMLFAKGYTPGRKVFIKLNGLAIGKISGSMQLGFLNPDSTTQLNRISESDFQNYIFPSNVIVSEDSLVRVVTLAEAVDDVKLNTLLELTSVEFADNSLGRSFYDINSGGFATNHEIVDYTLGGRTRFLRISEFAAFSASAVPSGRGNIRGVMTKFGSTYQFIIRQKGDLKLDQPRAYTYYSTLNEDFNNYTSSTGNFDNFNFTSFVAFPNYVNFATEGVKKWFIKSNALEISAFSGNSEKNKAYFAVPVDMTAASTFQFDLTVAFFSSSIGLKIYRSNDYVPGKKISEATLYDISTAFSSALPSTNASLVGLTYNIPASVTGNGFIIFEYTGNNITTSQVVTTTITVDNIVIN